jgi:hypothetical protein
MRGCVASECAAKPATLRFLGVGSCFPDLLVSRPQQSAVEGSVLGALGSAPLTQRARSGHVSNASLKEKSRHASAVQGEVLLTLSDRSEDGPLGRGRLPEVGFRHVNVP